MLVDGLKLNKDMTELQVISAKHLPKPILQEMSVVNQTVRSSQKARNIGVIFHNNFLSNDQVFANHLSIISLTSVI